MNPSSSLKRRPGRNALPAFFFAHFAFGSLVLAAIVAFLSLANRARADLLVLQPGGGGTGNAAVWRFNETSGSPIKQFGAPNEGYVSMTVTGQDEVYATTNIIGGYEIQAFNRAGLYLGDVARISQGGLYAVSRGPGGNLYCVWYDQATDRLRIGDLGSPTRLRDGETGPTPRVFVENGAGGMLTPTWMVFGPDGNLYVADQNAGILRFNGTSGAAMGVFVPPGRGGLTRVNRMTFGPDGRCYVSTGADNSVLRFDGSSGAFVDAFVASGSGGLNNASGLAFGPDGHLYVASRNSHQVLRYHGGTGAYLGVAATEPTLRFPSDVAFTSAAAVDSVWFDDALPAGAVANGEAWQWVGAAPAPFSGTLAHHGTFGSGFHEHWFNFAQNRMEIAAGDSVFVEVFVEAYNSAASEIMLSWCDGAGWEHRAYWGANVINAGQNGQAGRRYMGALPRAGGWVRLEVPAATLDLEGKAVQGMAFSTNDVRATWDRIGKSTPVGDNSAPAVVITAPAAGATVTGNMTVTAAGTDDVGVTRVEFSLDGLHRTVLVDSPASPYSANWDTRAFSNGSHVINVTVRDAAGNQASDSRTINVQNTDDVTNPAVAITSPASNATVSGVVTVNVSASDNVGVQRVEFEIYGAIIARDMSVPYSATWDSRSFPDGNYTFIVRAYDTSGNMSAATAAVVTNNAGAPPPPAGGTEVVWMDDAFPAGAWGDVADGDAWSWVTANPPPFSGSRAHQSVNAAGVHSHAFNEAGERLAVGTGDQLMAYVFLDPANPPQEVMLSWSDGVSWDHRAYWGADVIPYGNPGSAGRVRAGDLPAIGGWVRLAVSAAALGLEGRSLSGMSFIVSNGRATWDRAGKIVASSSPPPPPPPPSSGGGTPSPDPSRVQVWMDGAVPQGAGTGTNGGDAWNWVTLSSPASPSGSPVHQSNLVAGLHEHFFNFAWTPLSIASGDTLFVYILVDPANPPREIMLSWCDGRNWEHRAYWGANVINAGLNNSASRCYMGAIPTAGAWVQLQISAAAVGLVGQNVQGMAFSLVDGRATWDTAGKVGP